MKPAISRSKPKPKPTTATATATEAQVRRYCAARNGSIAKAMSDKTWVWYTDDQVRTWDRRRLSDEISRLEVREKEMNEGRARAQLRINAERTAYQKHLDRVPLELAQKLARHMTPRYVDQSRINANISDLMRGMPRKMPEAMQPGWQLFVANHVRYPTNEELRTIAAEALKAEALKAEVKAEASKAPE